MVDSHLGEDETKERKLKVLSYLKHLDNQASRRQKMFSSRKLGMRQFRQTTLLQDLSVRSSHTGVREEQRCEIVGKATLISKKHLIKGRLENISCSGAYISCEANCFDIKETLRLKIIPEGETHQLKSEATVVRVEPLAEGRVGYGLRFVVAS